MKKIFLLFLAALLIFQVACAKEDKDEIGSGEIEENISLEVAADDKIIIERSESLSDYLVELFGVDDAATIIFNDTALVTVVMAYDSDFTKESQELIEGLVLEKDQEISQVIVSNDEKIFKQVVNIINSLMNGNPYDKHVGDISKLIEKARK